MTAARWLVLLMALGPGTALAQALALPPSVTPAPVVSQAPAAPPLARLFTGLASASPQEIAPDSLLASASEDLQAVARWVARSGDNAGLPYLLVDKANAQVYAFDAGRQLRATAPALLGLAIGDKLKVSNDTVMAQMGAGDRITPAGRFLSRLAIDSEGKELLVLDYAAAISLHAVVKGTPEEHRAERLASPTSSDNRVSYGCINVPAAFYDEVVSRFFAHTRGVVYVLPETSAAAPFFGFQPAREAPAARTAIVGK